MRNLLHDLARVRIWIRLELWVGSGLELQLRLGLGQKPNFTCGISKFRSAFCKLRTLTNRAQHRQL